MSGSNQVNDIDVDSFESNNTNMVANGSQYYRQLRSVQAVNVGVNVYPESASSLTQLGSAVFQMVGSGALTQGLNNAGLQVLTT